MPAKGGKQYKTERMWGYRTMKRAGARKFEHFSR
jgi:hypothetical protein